LSTNKTTENSVSVGRRGTLSNGRPIKLEENNVPCYGFGRFGVDRYYHSVQLGVLILLCGDRLDCLLKEKNPERTLTHA